MTEKPYLERILGQPLDLEHASPDQRASVVRGAVSDLHLFFDEGRPIAERRAPPRSVALASALFERLQAASAAASGEAAGATGAAAAAALPPAGVPSLRERIVTDDLLRGEADRDQNVYLGKLFTRRLTQAVPDVIFLPISPAEASAALKWARESGVPVTLRGAASTAMGGSVPNEGGLTLDLSRLDSIEVDTADRVCVVGAGARMRTVHQRLAEKNLALKVYPSNLGGTLAGWFATGGIGLNAYGHGRALDSVRAADVLLPAGEHVRFHDDGRLGVPDGARRKTIPAMESAAWFRAHYYEPMTLGDLAGSEGVFGAILHLTVSVEPRAEIGAFLLAFDNPARALEAVAWIAEGTGSRHPAPMNVKFLSGAHMQHTRKVWRDEDSRAWHEQPGELTGAAMLPWTRISGPGSLGVRTDEDPLSAAYLFVDFFDLAAARRFAASLAQCPGRPFVLDQDSVRFARERFKPQQTKRLGPGLIAAEIVMPADQVPRFLPRAEKLAHNAGCHLDAEIYYLADGSALFIGAYLTDHRSGAFALDLMLAPALLDLAMLDHGGKPYVLGRWQAAWAAKKFDGESLARMKRVKTALDPQAIVNRGILLGLALRGPLGRIAAATFAPGIAFVRGLYSLPAAVWPVRALLGALPGPARGHGEPAVVGATFTREEKPAHRDGAPERNGGGPAGYQAPDARALHCVNCGECNSVCPIFHDSKVRLPQMLTHLGEAMHAGEKLTESGSTLLDLCMRCGNCEEVCQAGIPHLPLYETMQRASDHERPRHRERHLAILAAVRGSTRYLRDFLKIRAGGYLKRSPASLPGLTRFVLFRAENDAGPAATCIHCGACVGVCPTGANHEFEGKDPRWITTEQSRCIGCGTCVEVCPANHLNGGQTLRVVEAPTRDWFVAIEDFEKGRELEKGRT